MNRSAPAFAKFVQQDDSAWELDRSRPHEGSRTRMDRRQHEGVDYEDDGLTYDVITHGAQLTFGLQSNS